ncbi:hypothetical protein ACUY2T_06050 [Corynebacterium sp. 22_2729]
MTYPQGNDDQTRMFNTQGNGGYGGNYDRGYSNQNYSNPNYNNPNYYNQPQQDPREGLLAGRYDGKKVAMNLIVLAVLAAAVTFAAVFIVDLLVGFIPGEASSGVGPAVLTGVIAGVIGVLAGLLYIPVSGTGNEHLFGMAVIALAAVAAIAWVLAGGLLSGDWGTLVTLTGIVCTAAIAYVVPTRIESAAVYGPRR